MLNAERFKEEINKLNNDFGLADNIVNCETLGCRNCRFSNFNNSNDEIIFCSTRKVKWLLSEYKEPIKVSKFEYDILKYISYNTVYLYIARDKSGFLGVYRSEPDRLNTSWCCCNSTGHLDVFTELFQFVQWSDEKPRAIKDILDNCEVVNDDL